jgi:hypothetical protein
MGISEHQSLGAEARGKEVVVFRVLQAHKLKPDFVLKLRPEAEKSPRSYFVSLITPPGNRLEQIQAHQTS